jgi:hypothetical protein
MIPRIHQRGRDLPGLLRYLFGPGREEEHTDPRLVAGSVTLGALDRLEPLPDPVTGRRSHRRLVSVLSAPLDALFEAPPSAPVWHCSLRLAPADPVLGDGAWERICREFMAAIGLARPGDAEAMPWVAVRHGSDHVHIAGVLARLDGFSEPARDDYLKARDAARSIEERLGLARTAPADRTAARGLTAAELRKAARLGRAEPPRVRLLRLVRAAVAHTGDEAAFAAWLRHAGLLVRLRDEGDGPIGYAVALPRDTTAGRRPVWFGGGRLAADLTLPRLRERWTGRACWTVPVAVPVASAVPVVPVVPVVPAGSVALAGWAVPVGSAASVALAGSAVPAGSGGPALVCVPAAADRLTRHAWAAEGVDGGPVTAAARLVDRAARGPGPGVGGACPGHRRELAAGELAGFTDALAAARSGAARAHQAAAARQAGDLLRSD